MTNFVTLLAALFVREGWLGFAWRLFFGAPFAGRYLLTGQPFDITKQAALFAVTEGDGDAVGAGACRTTDAVNI
jgi:hypothetical protein